MIFEYLDVKSKIIAERVCINWQHASRNSYKLKHFKITPYYHDKIASGYDNLTTANYIKQYNINMIKYSKNYLRSIKIERNAVSPALAAEHLNQLTEVNIVNDLRKFKLDIPLQKLFFKNTNISTVKLKFLQLSGHCFNTLTNNLTTLIIKSTRISDVTEFMNLLYRCDKLEVVEINNCNYEIVQEFLNSCKYTRSIKSLYIDLTTTEDRNVPINTNSFDTLNNIVILSITGLQNSTDILDHFKLNKFVKLTLNFIKQNVYIQILKIFKIFVILKN